MALVPIMMTPTNPSAIRSHPAPAKGPTKTAARAAKPIKIRMPRSMFPTFAAMSISLLKGDSRTRLRRLSVTWSHWVWGMFSSRGALGLKGVPVKEYSHLAASWLLGLVYQGRSERGLTIKIRFHMRKWTTPTKVLGV